MNEEIKFDHFKNIDELLEHIDIWYKEDDIDYTRWFGLTDLYQLGKYITDLKQKYKKLKQKLYDIEKKYDEKSLFAEDSILTELEEYLVKITKNGANIEKITCSNILVYLKELKEKYK